MLDLDGLVLDMDGVLWRGPEPLPGLVSFFETMNQLGLGFLLATNNSTQTVMQFVDKLAGMGVEIRPEQIITSACAAADYLLTIAEPGTRVYAVGEEGLLAALQSRGFELTANDARFVVAGLDRGFSFDMLVNAMELILGGAAFVGTNSDRTFPSPAGLRPGAGSILAAITAATGVEPTIIGKPGVLMFQQALLRLGTLPERTAMVGDRIETDILGARKAGLKTVLVLSGVTNRADLARTTIQPDWVFEDIRGLTTALKS